MNTRMIELFELAGISDSINEEFGIEYLAQLIIQECAQVADIERDTSAGCGYITKTRGMLIKEHFGVER